MTKDIAAMLVYQTKYIISNYFARVERLSRHFSSFCFVNALLQFKDVALEAVEL